MEVPPSPSPPPPAATNAPSLLRALPLGWQAFLNATIRKNKSAAIMNMGKGVYGLKEWGRSGQSKELKQASPEAGPGPAARTASTSSSSSKTNAPGARTTSLSPSAYLC